MFRERLEMRVPGRGKEGDENNSSLMGGAQREKKGSATKGRAGGVGVRVGSWLKTVNSWTGNVMGEIKDEVIQWVLQNWTRSHDEKERKSRCHGAGEMGDQGSVKVAAGIHHGAEGYGEESGGDEGECAVLKGYAGWVGARSRAERWMAGR